MKKVLILVLVGMLPASLLTPTADAGSSRQQVVEGTVLLPAPFAQSALDPDAKPFKYCWNGLHRRVATLAEGGQGQGVFGYNFAVDKRTWGKPFKLEVTGGQGTIDLDIAMYQRIANLEDWEADPVNAGCAQSCEIVDHASRGQGGETGIVPRRTIVAFVCLYGGSSHAGFDASFKYVAGKGVPKPKG